MSENLWSLKSIRLGSRKQPRLEVEELDLPVGVTAVIGKSGAGKTSLLNLLVGFESPDAGVVALEHTANVSWVPSDFGLWSHLTAREHLQVVSPISASARRPSTQSKDSSFPLTLALSPEGRGDLSELYGGPITSLLQGFDLGHVADNRPETLSMGERARLAVVRSLATWAKVLVMDEPFAHVDPGRIDRYWRELRRHVDETGSSLIFSSHSPHVVLREADRVICLDDGSIVWQGVPAELYSNPESESLAQLMGPANWFSEEDVSHWMPDEKVNQQCLRPQQLDVVEHDQSLLIVSRFYDLGSCCQSEIAHAESGDSRTFYHRASRTEIAPGSRVALKFVLTCLLLLCMVCFNGCRESSGDQPALEVEHSKIYSLPSEGAALPAPRGMTFDPVGRLYVLDDAGRVIVYDQSGNLSRRWWMPEYDVGKPEGAWVLLDGRIAVADTHYNRIVFFDKEGKVLDTLGEFGHGEGQFIYTVAVTQDPQGFLYVAEYGGNDRVQKFTAEGEFVTMFGSVGTEDGQFQRPSGLVWQDDVLYVADAINNRIQAFTPDGEFLRIVADAQTTGLHYPYDLSEGPDGSLYVAEYGAGRISRVSIDGKLLGRYGQEGRGEGQFWTPWGIAVSRDGKIAVADTGNRRVVELQL